MKQEQIDKKSKVIHISNQIHMLEENKNILMKEVDEFGGIMVHLKQREGEK